MSATTQTLPFQAEVKELLDLMIHSLYSHKEIFLRELISNASDALDKLRVEGLKDPQLFEGQESLWIRLETDPAARTLAVIDSGIGMTRDEVIANIGTIASSGTRRFLKEMKDARQPGEELPGLIGQFGVGFYSAFMVADEVVLETRRAGQAKGVRWTSRGDGSYTLEDIERAERGTRVTLHLKALDEDEAGAKDFTAEWVLREIVKRYSDFVEHPVQMEVERMEVKEGDEEGEREKVTKLETLNSMRPLWTRPRAEITKEEHAEFYKHLAHDWEPPLEAVHFKAEGTLEYTALLYLPKRRMPGLFDPEAAKSRVALYVKRVFITDSSEELIPGWLRFVRGLVDSADLPLNVSRETLQHARQLGQIRKRIVGKLIESFKTLLAERREEYESFFEAFGPVLKEGLWYDDERRQELAAVCLFRSSKDGSFTTLPEYIARAPVGQKAIYVLSAPDLESAKRSPHLEVFQKRGQEVLLLVDQVDEFAMSRLTEFEGKPLRSIAKGDLELEDSDEAKAAVEQATKDHAPLLAAAKEELSGEVGDVRFSTRLVDSAAVLVSEEGAFAPHVERLMRESGQSSFGAPRKERILELNPSHPLTARLSTLAQEDRARFGDYLDLLLGQALLAEGSPLPDPNRFASLVTGLLVGETKKS